MILLIFIIFIATTICHGQTLTHRQAEVLSEKYASSDSGKILRQNVRIVFYNVENLYDPYEDSTKLDDEFTASGSRNWYYSRFQDKLNHISKTLLAAGGWETPAIIGLCEIENKYVLNKLVFQTPLKKFGYRIIHRDSPDLRGVDVALLYRPEKFSVISWRCLRICFPFDTTLQTREILMVKGTVFQNDTLILFVNHWPSRRGGYAESEPKRNFVAGIVRSAVDSIFATDTCPNIIITGDFNDEPENKSLSEVLKAGPMKKNSCCKDLINLMHGTKKKWKEGTLKYQGQWSVFDQFIVSGNLVRILGEPKIICSEAHIFEGDFLLEKDDRNFGNKLKRTYAGPRYLGGFSDHLPVYLDLLKVAK